MGADPFFQAFYMRKQTLSFPDNAKANAIIALGKRIIEYTIPNPFLQRFHFAVLNKQLNDRTIIAIILC